MRGLPLRSTSSMVPEPGQQILRSSVVYAKKKKYWRARTCVPYDQIGCVVLLVETWFEPPDVNIHPVPAEVPLSIRWAERIIHPGVATLYDDVGVAFLCESVEHWLGQRSLDE